MKAVKLWFNAIWLSDASERVCRWLMWGIFMLSLELGQKATRPLLLGFGWWRLVLVFLASVSTQKSSGNAMWNFSYYFGGWCDGGEEEEEAGCAIDAGI